MWLYFRYREAFKKRFKKNESSTERCWSCHAETEEYGGVKGHSQTAQESGQYNRSAKSTEVTVRQLKS